MTSRQKRLYKDRCDLYKATDPSDAPTYTNIPCLLKRNGVHKYNNGGSELNLNQDTWYFSNSQPIEQNGVICLKTKDHPEKNHYWLMRGTPKARGGKINHWEIIAERHFIFPKSSV